MRPLATWIRNPLDPEPAKTTIELRMPEQARSEDFQREGHVALTGKAGGGGDECVPSRSSACALSSRLRGSSPCPSVGATTAEVPSGHLPMVSHPADVVKLTETAAEAGRTVDAVN